jgi:hypothetical protein
MNFDELDYPLWIIVESGSVIETEPGKWVLADHVEFALLTNPVQEKSLPVFRSLESATRFAEASDMHNEQIVSIEDKSQFLDRLSEVKNVVSYVVFDPEKAMGTSRLAWPIEYVIRRVQDGSSERNSTSCDPSA